MNDNTALWWVIKGPVVGSIMVSILETRRGEETGPGQKTGEEEIQRSLYKPSSFLFMATLYSGTWIRKLFSYPTSVGHLYYLIFPHNKIRYLEQLCA